VGGSSWSETENVGCFLTPTGQFRSRRKDGSVSREWLSLGDLLAEELPAVAARDRAGRPGPPMPWFGRGGV
jgi:hypothetical protein